MSITDNEWKNLSSELNIPFDKLVGEYLINVFPLHSVFLFKVYERANGVFYAASAVKFQDSSQGFYRPISEGYTEVEALRNLLLKIADIVLKFNNEMPEGQFILSDTYEF
jgi:hypothetical protein